VLIGLVLSIRRGAGPLPGRLARQFGIWLVVAPGIEMLFYGSLVCGLTGYSSDPFLRFMQGAGGHIAAAAWVLLAVPMCLMLADPRRLIRRRRVLAVPAAMALLAVTQSGSMVASMVLDVVDRGGLGQMLQGHWMIVGGIAVLSVIGLLVSAVPLLGMVMLIVHSARARSGPTPATSGGDHG